jgi:general secretion pathway protein B
MSLILEALKKAERQHKLGKVPGISAQAMEQEDQRGKRLGWGVLALLALAMLGVGIYLGSMQNSSQPQVQVQSVPEPQAKPKARAQAPVGELTARPVRSSPPVPASEPKPEIETARPVTLPQPAASKLKPVETKKSETAKIDTPPVRPVPVQAPPEPPPPKARPLHEMPGGFVSNLPAMNIDIHSYASKPGKRYVLINMEKYREGDYLAEGPLLIEILPDGVVMEHMGERFKLPLGNY